MIPMTNKKYIIYKKLSSKNEHMLKKLLKSALLLFTGFGILIILIFVLIFWQGYRFWIQSPPKSSVSIEFEIEEGEGLKIIANRLKEKDLIANTFWFEFYARLDGSARDIQVGEFLIFPQMSYSGLIDELINADMDETQITIPEGYTIEQIGEVVRKNFDIPKTDWDTAVGLNSSLSSHEFVVDSNKPTSVDLEGYLFPETYRFFIDADAESIVEGMIDQMQSEVMAISDEYLSSWSIHDVLTLASIIEREVQSPEDMARVADVFLKRLEVGMPLQADSTVNYITGGDSPSVTIDDTKIDSLYNTYLYAGLPPGPISSPGRDAIKAVFNPAPNDYYYFLTTSSGDVIYSSTYQQHLDNKYRYLR